MPTLNPNCRLTCLKSKLPFSVNKEGERNRKVRPRRPLICKMVHLSTRANVRFLPEKSRGEGLTLHVCEWVCSQIVLWIYSSWLLVHTALFLSVCWETRTQTERWRLKKGTKAAWRSSWKGRKKEVKEQEHLKKKKSLDLSFYWLMASKWILTLSLL